MRSLNFLIGVCFAGRAIAGLRRLDQQCPAQTSDALIFREKHTCGRLVGLNPGPEYAPWTHQPQCRSGIHPKTKKLQKFCIYTRSNNSSQRGISLFTTPDFADEFAQSTHLHRYDQRENLLLEPPYEKRELPGRGVGVVATRDISAGEVVLRDLPTMLLNNEGMFHVENDDRFELLWRGLMQLPEESRKATRTLAAIHGGDLIEDIARTNAVGVAIGKARSHGAILPELARINHSCRPKFVCNVESHSFFKADVASAVYRFDAQTMLLEIFALRDIKKGEELLISYTMTSVPTEYRKSILRKQWGFNCTCEICGASAERIEESDMRVMFIMEAKENIDKGETDVRLTLELAIEILDLYDQEGLITPKAEFCMIAAKAAKQLGEVQAALHYAQGAISYWGILAGEGSDEMREARQLAASLQRQRSAQ